MNDYVYATPTNAPIKFAKVKNEKGYVDLIVNKSANGKAIRISQRTGENQVNVSLNKVNDLITKLQQIASRGQKLSVDELPFNA